jgi:hypothetical protein
MGDRGRVEAKARGVRRIMGGLIVGVRLAIPVMIPSFTFLLIIAWTGFASPALAGRPVYRCTQNGQTILGDTPCQDTAAAASEAGSQSSTTIGGSSSMVGAWRGQTQYQGSQSGQQIGEAHTVVPLVLTFSADGKVSGTSPENGCQWLGVWTPGSTPGMFSLDVSFSSCRYAGFNGRFSGNLIATFSEQSAQLTLQAFDVFHAGQTPRTYDVKATLRR